MNVENINKLADALEDVQARDSELFDMNDWGDDMWCDLLGNMNIKIKECDDTTSIDEDEDPEEDYRLPEIEGITLDNKIDHCGSSGCIAGWAVLILGDGPTGQVVSEYAQSLLGLDDNVASQLFVPEGSTMHRDMTYGDVSAGMAADVLMHLAETGKVDWLIVDWDNPEEYDEDDDEDDEE